MISRVGRTHRRERGMVLFISLMFLIVMTLIGITAMSGAGLQEKMAGNMRDKELSFEAAEAALRDAEINILSAATLPSFTNANGLYVVTNNAGQLRFDANSWSAADWQNNANTVLYNDSNPLPTLAAAPRFYVERLPPVKDNDSLVVGTKVPIFKTYHRITARGVGQTDTAVTILQSTYARD